MDPSNDERRSSSTVNGDAVLELFEAICERSAEVVAANSDWRESGQRPGQYGVDLDVDAICVSPLLADGYSVLSEESGLTHPRDQGHTNGVVVLDPLDGSTNASLGLPWFATSLCLVIDGRAEVAMVTNLATGARYTAIRGSGALLDGRVISVAPLVALDDSVIAVSGLADHHYGWRQFRAMGASALDLCGVASGSFDGFVDMSADAHGVWDYAGALLIVEEAGGVVIDAFERPLIVLDHAARRTPLAASHRPLLDDLGSHRRRT